MDLLSIDNRSPKLDRVTRMRVAVLADAYQTHLKGQERCRLRAPSLQRGSEVAPWAGTAAVEGGEAMDSEGKYATSWLYQFGHLIIRSGRTV